MIGTKICGQRFVVKDLWSEDLWSKICGQRFVVRKICGQRFVVRRDWICGQTGLELCSGRRFVVRRFVVKDLWSDGTGTLLELVNRPPLF
jgi:hypothetical protein